MPRNLLCHNGFRGYDGVVNMRDRCANPKFRNKGMNKLIAINKEEKEIISKMYPNVHIVRTAKQRSKRHRYYCEENRAAMALLAQLRDTSGNNVSE